MRPEKGCPLLLRVWQEEYSILVIDLMERIAQSLLGSLWERNYHSSLTHGLEGLRGSVMMPLAYCINELETDCEPTLEIMTRCRDATCYDRVGLFKLRKEKGNCCSEKTM